MKLLEQINKRLLIVETNDYGVSFGSTKPGKTFNDLAHVHGPATANPIDDRPWVVKDQGGNTFGRFVKQGEAESFARSRGGRVVHVPNGEKTERWTNEEILAALKPIIIRQARQAAGHMFTGHKGGHTDREAFNDLVQNAMMAVDYHLKRGGDEARMENSFLAWITPKIRSAVRHGFGGGLEVRDTIGALRKLMEVKGSKSFSKAKSVADSIIKKIGEQYRTRKPGGEVDYTVDKKLNPFGQYSTTVFALANNMAKAADNKNLEMIGKIADAAANTHATIKEKWGHGEGRKSIMFPGAATGVHDSMNLPPSSGVKESYLNNILKAASSRDVEDILKHKRAPSAKYESLALKLKDAFDYRNPIMVSDVKEAVMNILKKLNTRSYFRMTHKQSGIESQSEEGETIEAPGMPTIPDDASKITQNKELLQSVLEAALEGITLSTGETLKIDMGQLRALIRLFGVANYPFKGTSKDPEFDFEGFTNNYRMIYPKLSTGESRKIPFKVYDSDEASDIASFIAEREAETQGEMEAIFNEIMGSYKPDSGIPKLQSSDPDPARIFLECPMPQEVVEHLLTLGSTSHWVRRGCPRMNFSDISKDLADPNGNLLGGNSPARRSQYLKKLIGNFDNKTGEFVSNPDSILGKLGRELADKFDLGENKNINDPYELILEAIDKLYLIVKEQASRLVNEDIDRNILLRFCNALKYVAKYENV